MRKNFVKSIVTITMAVVLMATPAYAMPRIGAYVPITANQVSSTLVMSVNDVFGSGTDEWSWHSDTTGYYIIPFYDSYSDTYNIWFTSANDTI